MAVHIGVFYIGIFMHLHLTLVLGVRPLSNFTPFNRMEFSTSNTIRSAVLVKIQATLFFNRCEPRDASLSTTKFQLFAGK